MITIDEAIRALQARVRGELYSPGVDYCEDMKLGIEALKGIKAVRQLHPELSPFPLPGETKDCESKV